MLGANGASAPPTFHRRGEGRASPRAWRRADLPLVRASLQPWLSSLLPFALFGVAYFALGPLRALVAARGVHVHSAYWFDKAVFGVGTVADRMSMNEVFARHHSTAVDVVTGAAYFSYIYAVAAFAIYVARADRTPPGRLRARAVGWTFLGVNLAGSATYVLFPVAPPWYVASHGFGPVDASTIGNAAALLRLDALTGVPYFRNFYAHATEVFGAMPSMHAAYPMILFLYARERRAPILTAALAVFQIVMCFAAVYLQHHYVADVIAGTIYAVLGYCIERLVNRRRAIQLGRGDAQIIESARQPSSPSSRDDGRAIVV